jgi:DNA gyrase subunit A
MKANQQKTRVAKQKTSEGFGVVRNESLAIYGVREMEVYATEVNLSRAVPDLIDGLKPVQRRVMWASALLGKDFVKTARLVGSVIGQYHPHGDKSVSDAITVMVQSNQPPLLGEGGWGSLIDPAAAMRYTSCTLSSYGRTFFLPDYINKTVTSFIPNYDETTSEPVTLPALLPNVLMTGAEGIGVGTTTCLPAFTAESLAQVIIRMLRGENLQVVDFAKSLKHYNRYGGQVMNTKVNRQAWMGLFKGDKARVMFEAKLDIDRDQKALEIDDWPTGLNPTKLVSKLRLIKEVDQAYNSKGATRIRVELDRGCNYAQFDKFVERVRKMTQVARSFKVNVTHRVSSVVDGVVSIKTDYLSLSVPQLLVKWLRERVELEKRSLQYRIIKQKEAIAYSELLIYVAQNADQIIKVIRQSMDPQKDLMKKFKLSDLQANQILDLQLRKISKLDQTPIQEKLKEQKLQLKRLSSWLAKPRDKVIEDTQQVLEAIKQDQQFEVRKDREMSIN